MLHKIKKIVTKIIWKHLIFTGLLLIILTPAPVQAYIITSIRPIAFISTAIANGVTDVKILLPNNASPHDYSLKPSDLKKIHTADLFIWIGSEMETFLKKPLAQLANTRVITLTDYTVIKRLLIKSNNPLNLPITIYKKPLTFQYKPKKHHNQNHFHGIYNMHIWLSPDIAIIAAKIIYDRLIYLYPHHRKQLDINLRKFEDNVTKTDKTIAKMLNSVGNKRYFVFHDAYGYFEKRYYLTSLGYFTINPNIQFGAKRLYEIRTILNQKKAVCIFSEPQFEPAVIKAIIKDTDVLIGTLDPLGSSIKLGTDSYIEFLIALSNQFKSCLEKKNKEYNLKNAAAAVGKTNI